MRGVSDEKKKARPAPVPTGERLQKILAYAGVASRRAAEEMIAAGRVSVNGKVVTEMGVRADPSRDTITVDGKPVAAPKGDDLVERDIYIMLHKPLDVVSTAKDTHGRPTVVELVRGSGTKDERRTTKDERPTPNTRIYPVGRLDADTTGLLLLTNNGELTYRLTHPKYDVEKEYRALVRGRPDEDALRKLLEGVEIEGELTAPAKVKVLGAEGGNTQLRIVIHEGRKRQVRLMCASVGHPALQLQRVRFGPLSLGDLQPGKWRYLAEHEVHALMKAVRMKPRLRSPRSPRLPSA